MRSIRSRLLITLLGLVSFVVLVLSWYVYTETAMALHDKKVATEQLLYSQCKERCKDIEEIFDMELRRQAERLATQVVAKVESVPFYRVQFVGVLPTFATGYGYVSMTGWLAEYGDRAVRNELQQKRTVQIFEEGKLFETGALTGHVGDEYFQIIYHNVHQRSSNLAEDCLNLSEYERQKIQSYEPIFLDAKMNCGKDLRYITLKMPLSKSAFPSPGSFGMFRRGPPPRSSPAEGRDNQANRNTSSPGARPGGSGRPASADGREIPTILPNPTIIVQVARESALRDNAIKELQQSLQEENSNLSQQSEQARQNLINRLALICLATIAATALGVTWLSRSSLKPLVQVADAVSNLTPKDLRLKFDSKEIKPEEMPEELAPIVQRLQESLQSLEQAFAREKRATADISHELRTPLASLMTTAQVALRKTRTPEEYKTTLKQCIETGSHLTTLVERLLMLSRLDAGVDQLQKEPVDVVEMAGQCVDMLRPLADQNHIEVELEVDDSANSLGLIESDASKLREILVNLIDNAVHYNKPEGHVTVRVSATDENFILEVIDTGMGMSPETRAHLFERFYRADLARQTDTVNAGLGLAIVKGYVDLFGGSIDVQSQLNEGSTFRVILPRVNETAPVLVG